MTPFVLALVVVLALDFASFGASVSLPSFGFLKTRELVRGAAMTGALSTAKGIASKFEATNSSRTVRIHRNRHVRGHGGFLDSDDATTGPVGNSDSSDSSVSSDSIEAKRQTLQRSDNDSSDSSDSSTSSDSSDSSDSRRPQHGGFAFGNAFSVTSTTTSTHTNWIGKFLRPTSATACYRKVHIAKTCPLGYDGKLGTCWAQCPLRHPIECGVECIRRNDNCALEVITKVSGVAQAALSIATNDAYGKFKLMAAGIQLAYRCSKEVMGLVKSLTKYVRTVRVSAPQTTTQKLLTMMYQTDNVVFDIPVMIASCTGVTVTDTVKFADRLVNTIMLTLKEIISKGTAITSSWSAFTTFMKSIGLGWVVLSLGKSDITSLRKALKSESTCGFDLKRMLDQTWILVAELRRKNPKISEDDLRVALSVSTLALYDIPTVTNNCMKEMIDEFNEPEAYATRDTLRKGFAGIMEDLIQSGTSSNGTFFTASQYAYSIADKVGSFYAVWEKKNIGGAMFEFFQPICGPTEFVGEIDDGSAEEALGLKTVGKAFEKSGGRWTKIGDGSVTITFQSFDAKDVTVNIKSAGDKIKEVRVKAGQNVTWSSTVKALEGKTLYLDRWRPGILGLPGVDEGSLLLWVPRSRQGGNLQLLARLNES
ncbi:unnamed protein product [Hyaloperonospora brassicae]|uniref:RxLR effector candidate protein n=1 Tax=Hyaloperonospora brassicae TaxID=162125 RepID=A0AAV0V410_HYABA|nr:unnamed protein product [Hyaloperonospora brassicae]